MCGARHPTEQSNKLLLNVDPWSNFCDNKWFSRNNPHAQSKVNRRELSTIESARKTVHMHKCIENNNESI